MVEESVREDLAGHRFEPAEHETDEHDGIGERVRDTPVAPVGVDDSNNERHKDRVLDGSYCVYLGGPWKTDRAAVLRRRPGVGFSRLRWPRGGCCRCCRRLS